MNTESFDNWFNEPEGFGLRSERLFDLAENDWKLSEKQKNVLVVWLKAAYYSGQVEGMKQCLR